MPRASLVNALRRRGDGERIRVYLDQSTMSRLVDDPARARLRELLVNGVQSERIVCPYSTEHTAESILAERLYVELDHLYEELCMGVDFYDDDRITWAEIHAAAADFAGEDPGPVWREAFRTNPDASRDELFPGGFRVVARLPHTDELVRAEVRHAKEATLAIGVYEEARAAGFTFEEQAEREFKATVLRELSPLVWPHRYAQQLARATEDVVNAPANLDPLRPGNPVVKLQSLAMKKTRVRSLTERYPVVAEQPEAFVMSTAVTRMPMLRYPALFHAALALTPGRKPKSGDRFDISHLTKGLSRCDIVTADSGMAQLCRDFGLVPDDCRLFGARELDALEASLAEVLES